MAILFRTDANLIVIMKERNNMKVIKNLVSILLTIILTLSFSVLSFASEEIIEYVQEEGGIFENVKEVKMGGDTFFVITEVVDEYMSLRAYPDKEVTKVFSHAILDRNGNRMATLHTTVIGVYSEADNTASILSIDGYFSGEYADYSTCSTSINGNTGSISIFFNGVSSGTLTYRISTNGNISNI